MRPMALALPDPAMPYTRVPNSSGAMIDLTSRRNTLLTGDKLRAASGKKCPNTTPSSMAMKIQAVNDGLFNAHPI